MAFGQRDAALLMRRAVLFDPSWGSTESLRAHATIDLALQQVDTADALFVRWIQEFARFADSGIPQWTVVALSLSWFCLDIWHERRQISLHGASRKTRSSYLIVSFEVLAESLRMAALAISCTGPWTTKQVATFALIATVSVFGLSGLLPRLPWRRIAVRHSNWLQLVTLMLLLMQDLLPGAIIGAKPGGTRLAVSRVTCIALSFLTAVALPRQPTTPPPVVLLRDGPGDDGPAEMETCSILSYLITYEWLTPLIWKGSRRPVTTEDLPKLPWYEQPSYLLNRIERARKKHPTSSLLTVLSFMRAEMLASAVWVSLSFASEMISPFALYQLLNYLSSPADAAIHPAVWVGILFMGPWFRSVSWQRYLYHSTHQALRVKAGFTLQLYRRATQSMEVDRDLLAEKGERTAPGTAAAKSARTITATGQMANLMASDIDAVINSRDVVQSFAGVPVGTTLALVGLYRVLGWSAFVGIAVILVLIPVPTWMSQLVGKVQRKVKRSQDSRISLISEYLQSIRTVKMFGWEDIMISKVAAARDGELAGLWRVWVYWLLMSEATELIPMFAMLSVFVSYVVVAKATLTAPVAFTTMSLIMILRKNLNMLTRLSRNITNAIISLERLDKYFNQTVAVNVFPEGPLSIQQATFRRSQNASFWLRDVSIDFVQGGLNAVLGPSGSGKTTLLLSILGETTVEGGRVTRPVDAAFASQTPWLQRSSIRDNILFYNALDKARYDSVLDACCLTPDLERLAHGDSMLIGENGAGLSGGQQSRVALTRALYSYAPLLLLDDIFSALDSKTAAAVWERCFCSELLRGRTVVLVTQLPWIEAQADLAIRMEQGAITSLHQNLGVKRAPVTLPPELEEFDGEGAANRLVESSANGDALQNDESQLNGKETKKRSDLWDEMQAGISHGHGRLLLFQYLLYFGGPVYAVFSILIIVASNAALIGTSLWLSRWVDAYNQGGEVDIAFYLSIYACFSIGVALINGVSFLTYANGSWVAAKRLHEMFIKSVMYVPLAWYNNVPVGRVVNRFSRDMDSLDSKLNRMVLLTCDAAVRLLFRLGAISSVLPIFVLPSFVICSLAVVAGEMYTRTVVVVRRLSSAAQSPIFSQFSDTLNGLPVIRARRDMPERFERKLAESMAEYNHAMQSNYDSNRWVGVRCDIAGAVVALCAGTIAVWKAQSLSAGLVGFSLTAAANISETILVLIRSLNDLEVELTSFYRVREYANLRPEEQSDNKTLQPANSYTDDPTQTLPPGWPNTGAVEFRNVTVRYDLGGQDILKCINLKFEAGDRVAVVGRTGSGKTTLALSLLRLTHVTEGQILFDGVDIAYIPLQKLRRSLTIIPQDAVLLNGTIATNLDPTGQVAQVDLDRTFDSCRNIASFHAHMDQAEDDADQVDAQEANGHASEFLPTSGITLSTPVKARGANFSHGQRQVLSLCRALVRKSKLMLLDEATASMDYSTDHAIQTVLRQEVAQDPTSADGGDAGRRTLVTIAHRLRTVADYDKVVVMASGQVAEFGSPKELFEARGTFYDMVCHSGEREELVKLMSREQTQEAGLLG